MIFRGGFKRDAIQSAENAGRTCDDGKTWLDVQNSDTKFGAKEYLYCDHYELVMIRYFLLSFPRTSTPTPMLTRRLRRPLQQIASSVCQPIGATSLSLKTRKRYVGTVFATLFATMFARRTVRDCGFTVGISVDQCSVRCIRLVFRLGVGLCDFGAA